MKGIQEFLKDLRANEELAKNFKGVEKAEDILNLAKENGYEFTEDDYMDAQMDSVSGGGIGKLIQRVVSRNDNEWEDMGNGMYRNRKDKTFWDSLHGSLRDENGYWTTNYRD